MYRSFVEQFYCAGSPVIDVESLQAISNTDILRIETRDHIFVAISATNPFVFRPVADDKSFSEIKIEISTFYQFIVGSYVHGIMGGEVLDIIDGTTVRGKAYIWYKIRLKQE
jgi:hypothetical protein